MEAADLLPTVASELHLAEADVLKEGLTAFLEHQLRQVRAVLFEICGRYRVAGADALESRYRECTLSEADSWRDLQRLDHLEYRKDRLEKLLLQIR